MSWERVFQLWQNLTGNDVLDKEKRAQVSEKEAEKK